MTYLGDRNCRGMGLLDLLLAVIIALLSAAVAIPAFGLFAERAKVAHAVDDIDMISIELERFTLKNSNQLPGSLDELPIEIPLDPWGVPYQYLNIMATGPGNGDFRKDGNLNPLNSDFDLYSAGADGETKGPLSAKASRDDIVRANDGAFVGLGEDY